MTSLYDTLDAAGALTTPPLTGQGGPGRGQGRKPTGDAPKATTSISIDVGVLAAAREAAARQGISLSSLIEALLRAALDA